MEEDSSNFDDEDMAIITRKFKKFFKKTKKSAWKKNFSKLKNTDWEQFSGCFKCGKLDHIVKNCPLLKEEQDQEQPRKQAGNRLGTVPAGVSREPCLQLGETQQKKKKELKKRRQ